MRKLIIIPAYNEGMNIEATVKDIQENYRTGEKLNVQFVLV